MLEIILMVVIVLAALVVAVIVADHIVGCQAFVHNVRFFVRSIRPLRSLRHAIRVEHQCRRHNQETSELFGLILAIETSADYRDLPWSIRREALDLFMDIKSRHHSGSISFKKAVRLVDRVEGELIRAKRLLG